MFFKLTYAPKYINGMLLKQESILNTFCFVFASAVFILARFMVPRSQKQNIETKLRYSIPTNAIRFISIVLSSCIIKWLLLKKIGSSHIFPVPRSPAIPYRSVCMTQAVLLPVQNGRLSALADHFAQYLSMVQRRYLPKDLLDFELFDRIEAPTFFSNPSIFEHCGIHSSIDPNRWSFDRPFDFGINFEDTGRAIVFDPSLVTFHD